MRSERRKNRQQMLMREREWNDLRAMLLAMLMGEMP
jgi:hypothetical protein